MWPENVSTRTCAGRRQRTNAPRCTPTRLIRAHPDILCLGLIALAATSLRLLFFPNAPAFFESHAREYLVGAFELLAGETYSREKVLPGYSLFIASVLSLTRSSLQV